MSRSLNGLLFSRKVWIAVLGVITAIVSYYASVPQEVWLPIEALLLTLIVTICAEDVAEKRAGSTLIVNNLPSESDMPLIRLDDAAKPKGFHDVDEFYQDESKEAD